MSTMRVARIRMRTATASRYWRGVAAALLALSVACGADAGTRPPVEPAVAPGAPGTPVTPIPGGPSDPSLQRVEVTTLTTGVRLDPDGYGILNDEWDYDVGDGATVTAPTNGTAVLYLRAGPHVLSVVGVARNCRGEDISDRSITVTAGDAATPVLFKLVCTES
jgi:hypothetical protein